VASADHTPKCGSSGSTIDLDGLPPGSDDTRGYRYFRCPDELPEFEITGALSQTPGYSPFGSDVTCYGKSSSAHRSKRVAGPLYDALTDTSVSAGVVRLPLDADEIIGNLRHERYQRDAGGGGIRLAEYPALRTLYYRLRDLRLAPFAGMFQKIALGRLASISFPNWPVDGTVERSSSASSRCP